MTNAEMLLKKAIEALNNMVLTTYEREFIESIQHYSKKDLRQLASAQYNLLKRIADKA